MKTIKDMPKKFYTFFYFNSWSFFCGAGFFKYKKFQKCISNGFINKKSYSL